MAKAKSKKVKDEANKIIGTALKKKKDAAASLYSVPFRHLGLQKITNGVQAGWLCEFRGESQSGKSFLLYELMAESEKMGGHNLLFDLEHALEESYKPTVGITDERTEVEYETAIEKIVPLATKFVERIREKNKKCPIIIGIDSWVRIKTLEVQKSVEKGIEREHGATDAMRTNNIIFDELTPLFNLLSEENVVLIILNQLRTNYLQMFGDKTTSRGNSILQYECHLRLTGKLRGQLKVQMPSLAGTKDLVVGSKTEWTTTKNRGVKPLQSVVTTLRYAKGINPYSGLEELLVNDETVVAELKVAAKPEKEKDLSEMTDKQRKKYLAQQQIKKAKKASPDDFKFRMKKDNSENPVWYENIKDLVKAHPDALEPLITGKYSVNEEDEIVEDIEDEE